MDHDVCCVIFEGMPRCLTDYNQGAGRGGRKENTISFSILLVSNNTIDTSIQQYKEELNKNKEKIPRLRDSVIEFQEKDLEAIGKFMKSSNVCACQLISSFMDGVDDLSYCLSKSAVCDFCIQFIPQNVSLIYRENILDCYKTVLYKLVDVLSLKAHSKEVTIYKPNIDTDVDSVNTTVIINNKQDLNTHNQESFDIARKINKYCHGGLGFRVQQERLIPRYIIFK